MKTKIIGLFVGILGMFFMVGISYASTAEIIQPASIVYNENMTVNGELNVNSLRVGSEGVGGVTYFNGTIVNIGESIPVTFGDDVRIDGEIWRGPSKGQADNQPLKFSDSLTPTDTNAYNLGFSNKRWKDLYLAGYLYGEDIIVGRELWGGTKKGIIDGDDPLFVSDSMYPTLDDINNLGSANNRWNDLYLSGMLQGNNAAFTGDVDFSGANVTGLAISGDYLPLSGGTLTDDLIISGSTNFLHVDGFASVDNVATFGGGYSDPGVTISTEGDLSMGGNLVVDGNLDMEGGLTINDTGSYNDKIEVGGGGYASGVSILTDPSGGHIVVSDSINSGGNANIDGDINVSNTSSIYFGNAQKLRIPWINGQDPTQTCLEGEIYARTDAGNEKLFVCNSSGNWVDINY